METKIPCGTSFVTHRDMSPTVLSAPGSCSTSHFNVNGIWCNVVPPEFTCQGSKQNKVYRILPKKSSVMMFGHSRR